MGPLPLSSAGGRNRPSRRVDLVSTEPSPAHKTVGEPALSRAHSTSHAPGPSGASQRARGTGEHLLLALHRQDDAAGFGVDRLAGLRIEMNRTPPSLVDLTTELVTVPSVSGDEGNLAALVHKRLASLPGGAIRSGNNVVFRGPEK